MNYTDSKYFDDIASEHELKPFVQVGVGELYITSQRPRQLVRKFENEQHAVAYGEISRAVGALISSDPALSRVAAYTSDHRVGRDFVLRDWVVFQFSLSSYEDPDEFEPTDVAPAQELRSVVASWVDGRSVLPSQRDRVLTSVIEASLFHWSSKTILEEDPELWRVVEPVITAEHLSSWRAAESE